MLFLQASLRHSNCSTALTYLWKQNSWINRKSQEVSVVNVHVRVFEKKIVFQCEGFCKNSLQRDITINTFFIATGNFEHQKTGWVSGRISFSTS